jgi:hypothetical protein
MHSTFKGDGKVREELEVLHDIRLKVDEARMLAKVLPDRRNEVCVQVLQLVELAVECVRIMGREK